MVRPLRRVRALRSDVIALVISAAFGAPLLAQDAPLPPDSQAPAHVSFVDGVVVLERDGQADDSPGNMPLLAGDRIRTRGGRVEILFADGSTLHLDHNSAVDLQSDDLIRIIEGRIRLSIPGPPRAVAYRIDGPHGWAQITEPGDYRVALLNGPGGAELELAVLRGRAALSNDDGQTPLRAGERAFARAGAAPSYAYVANSAAFDAFDRWSESRRDERISASAEYLPQEVRSYARSFERDGDWRDEPVYGRVWYPRVEHDWRPYYRGRWVSLRPYGWTWVAYDRWGWPTHHYGRWGYSPAGAWFWIPGRTWGAAWVSWASAPGYVSWCPLGWNNRPVFQMAINVRGGHDPWRAWTVIPQRNFGYGYVHRHVVRPGYLDSGTRAAFAYRNGAPEIRNYAVPRGAAPIRVAGTGGPRRGGAPLYTNLPADQGRMRNDGARIQVPAGGGNAALARNPAPRERALPSRPAVRSVPPAEAGARVRPGVREPDPAPDRTGDDRRTSGAPVTGSRPNPNEDEPRGNPRVAAPSYRGTPATGRPGAARIESAPATPPAELPSYRGPVEVHGQRPRYRAEQPAPADQPSADRPRAVPRAAPAGPGGAVRDPQVDRRGSDRPSPGSYEPRAPAPTHPSPSSQAGDRAGGGAEHGRAAAAPPEGARPRPSGQAPSGGAVRRPGGRR